MMHKWWGKTHNRLYTSSHRSEVTSSQRPIGLHGSNPGRLNGDDSGNYARRFEGFRLAGSKTSWPPMPGVQWALCDRESLVADLNGNLTLLCAASCLRERPIWRRRRMAIEDAAVLVAFARRRDRMGVSETPSTTFEASRKDRTNTYPSKLTDQHLAQGQPYTDWVYATTAWTVFRLRRRTAARGLLAAPDFAFR